MTQPGWYPDPASPFSTRWWDGQRWTNDTYAALAGKAVIEEVNRAHADLVRR